MAFPTATFERRFFAAYQRYVSAAQPARCLPHCALRTSNSSKLSRQTQQLSRALHTTRTLRKESLRPQTHYEMFPQTLSAGPPPAGPFAVDTRALRREFLQLQSKAHPDMHAGVDKARAEGLSTLINEAYKTLQDPLRRAQYLLALKCVDVAEDETAKVEDPELLMDVLEARENIEEAQQESDLQPLRQVNEKRIAGSVEELACAVERDDVEAAKEEAVRLRYWMNIRQSLDAWERGKPVVLVH